MTTPIEGNNSAKTEAPYQVDHLGRIKINTIQDEPLFNYANEVDDNQNGLVENRELTKFLDKFGEKTKEGYYVYDAQYDDEGKLKQKSFSLNDGTQITFFYKDDKPNKCYWLYPSGVVNDMNLETGEVKKFRYDITDAEHKEWQLNDKNLLRIRRMGQEKPMPKDFAAEFVIRLLTWDWDWGW